MNNNITEDYCSFEVSKLLKEKGLLFPKISTFRVIKDCGEYPWQKQGAFIDENEHLDETCCPNHEVDGRLLIQCPTHALAIKWIRENFDVHIMVLRSYTDDAKFFYEVNFVKDSVRKINQQLEYSTSYELATEAALLHTLKIISHDRNN